MENPSSISLLNRIDIVKSFLFCPFGLAQKDQKVKSQQSFSPQTSRLPRCCDHLRAFTLSQGAIYDLSSVGSKAEGQVGTMPPSVSSRMATTGNSTVRDVSPDSVNTKQCRRHGRFVTCPPWRSTGFQPGVEKVQ
ncbi:hypothetical protein J2X69_003366 [Algoriphagus sp. 4150]|nr:hypothetical protein [Algoriphagus sp. 4150]